jgi:hypothetical protein
MHDIYRPPADFLEKSRIPGLNYGGRLWNRHLDNQININRDILNNRGLDSHSGGVDLNLRRKAIVNQGDWGVGAWFGLAYHVEPDSLGFLEKEDQRK